MSARSLISGVIAGTVVILAGPPATPLFAAAAALAVGSGRPRAIVHGLLAATAGVILGRSSPAMGAALLVAGELAFDDVALRAVRGGRCVALVRARELALAFAAGLAGAAGFVTVSSLPAPAPVGPLASGAMLAVLARLAVRPRSARPQRLTQE
jgi:hypothetical protein